MILITAKGPMYSSRERTREANDCLLFADTAHTRTASTSTENQPHRYRVSTALPMEADLSGKYIGISANTQLTFSPSVP